MKNYCRICTGYGQTLPGFPLRRGSIYGANSGRLFVCEAFTKTGDLHVYISRDSGKHWERETVKPENKIYQAIYTTLKTRGSIPQVTTFRDPNKHGRIVGQPKDRNPQREYTYKNGMSYHSLRKQNCDNADFGGGSDAEMLFANKNSVKTIVGKNTDRPKWEHPSKFKPGTDLSCHEGMMHDVSGRRIK